MALVSHNDLDLFRCFLACTLWIPFMVGKLMQFVFTPHQLPWLQLPVPEQHRAAKVVVQLAEWFGNLNSTKIHSYMQSVQSDQNTTSSHVTEGASSSPLLRRVVAELEADLVGIGLEDWVCLGLGYGKFVPSHIPCCLCHFLCSGALSYVNLCNFVSSHLVRTIPSGDCDLKLCCVNQLQDY